MKSQFSTESDEEYLDDPIKLFDSELERVHFGSQLGITASEHFYEPGEHIESDNDLSEELYSDSESSQERECLPSYIKLVDCAKFPWYYKRYTQQIIEKTSDICDLVSDSDSDVSGEHFTEDKSDCIIVEEEKSKADIVNKPNETSSKECSSDAFSLFLCKNLEERRLERMKRREDFELQRALSQKYTVNVDFKRNKGLIGMTIKQKFVNKINKTKISKVKEKKKLCVNKSYIKAADKALSNVGTELLVVPEVAENTRKNTNNTSEDGHKRHEVNELGENCPVKFCLGNISEKLLQRIKAKRRNNKCQTIKHQDDKLDTVYNKPKSGPNLAKPLKLSSFANKVSSSNVKNIEKTNKFKNSQAKAIESMLLHLLTKTNKKEVGIDSKKAEVVDQNPPKNTDNRCEPNSPILHCTLAKKIRKTNDNIKALENIVSEVVKKPVASNTAPPCSTSQTNMTSEVPNSKCNNVIPIVSSNCVVTSNQMVNTECETKSPKKCKINVIGAMTNSRVNSKKDTKKSKPKDTSQINKPETRQETTINGNIASKNNVSISDIQLFSSIPTIITPMTQTYVSLDRNNISTSNTAPPCSTSQTNITSQVPNSKCNNVIPIVSSNCVVTSNQMVKAGPNISNKITPTSTNVIHSQCNPVSVGNYNHITVFTTEPTRFSGGTGPGNELNRNNVKIRPYNSCLSAILRPPRPNEFFSNVRPIHPGQYGPEIQKPLQMQPRFYHNPYRGNYIPPNMRNKRFNPRLPNCTPANYQFPAPPPSPANCCKSLHNPSHYQSNRTWHMPNMYSEWDPRSELPRNPPPCDLPITVLQRPSTIVSSKPGCISEPMDTEQEKNRGQQDRCLKNPDSHDDWRNRKVLDPRLIKQDNKEVTNNSTGSEASSDLVTTKTKMLELLDSATNELKRCINADDNITEGILGDTFKLPKIAKLETVTDDFYSKQVDQRKGYSPPILPIPTFEKVLDQAKIETQQQDKQIYINVIPQKNIYSEMKNRNVLSKKTVNAKAHESIGKGKEKTQNKNTERKFTNDCSKRPVSVKSQKCNRKEEIKKISLEEYKKRTHLMAHQSSDSDKVKHRDKSNINSQRWVVPNIPKSKADRFSTESDLGYDSDSTVIL